MADEVAEVTTIEQWRALTSEQKISLIIEALDESRIDSFGGYPCEYTIRWGHIIIAEAEGKRPQLTIQPVGDWIVDYEWIVTDNFNEEEEEQ